MTTTAPRPEIDPELDLLLERDIDVPPELVWTAWTTPAHLCAWFTPAPWSTVEAEIDVRPGGIFRTVMQSPEGERFDDPGGCILEAVEHRRLVFTSALGPGYRPVVDSDLPFTAIISMEPAGDGTRYSALVRHADADTRQRHADMGFHDGWGTALDQLVALARTL
jgi:uncharacterized protein YndB with AHSA1/START domain